LYQATVEDKESKKRNIIVSPGLYGIKMVKKSNKHMTVKNVKKINRVLWFERGPLEL